MKNFKKILNIGTCILLIITTLLITNTSVLANVTVYDNISTERVADIPNFQTSDSISCTAMGGIGVGPQLKRLFVVKSKEEDNRAALYYFPNLYNKNDYQVITLKNIAGHANSMAIDYDYIYITRWRTDGTITKQITRISRDKIRNAYLDLKNDVVDEVVFNADDCTIFQPKVKNSDGTYSNFEYPIRTITKYKEDGQFLITYANSQVFKSGQVAYTVANVTDGKFVVSEKKKHIKVIQDSLFTSNTSGQAICYDDAHGLFIPRWHKNHKNTIVWVDIDGSYTTDSNGYRYYAPKGHIKIEKSSNIFTKYELESIAFDDQDYMIYSINTECTSSTYAQKYPDGIIRVTNNKFLL